MIINAKWVQLCLTNAEMNLLWPSRILSASLLQSLRLQPQLSAVSCGRSQEWSRVLQWSQWNLVFFGDVACWCSKYHIVQWLPPGWQQILGTQSECCSQDFTSMYNIFLAALGQVHASIGPPSRCYDWGCHDCKIQVFKYVSGFFWLSAAVPRPGCPINSIYFEISSVPQWFVSMKAFKEKVSLQMSCSANVK